MKLTANFCIESCNVRQFIDAELQTIVYLWSNHYLAKYPEDAFSSDTPTIDQESNDALLFPDTDIKRNGIQGQ